MATQLRTTLGAIADSIADDADRAHVELDAGGGAAPTPVEFALLALGACAATTYRFWSDTFGMRLDEVRVDVTGDLDLHGIFGLDAGVRPGCAGIDMHVTLRGPEAPASYEMLARTVDQHSPVIDLFTHGAPVTRHLTIS